MPIRLVLIDDHQLVRQGIKALLVNSPEVKIVGEASDAEQGLLLIEQQNPDVVLLDIAMPGMNGIELTRRLYGRFRILILSVHSAEPYVVEALQAGAMGYVLKSSSDAEELLTAIRAVASGQRYLGQPLSERAISAYFRGSRSTELDPYDTLSSREREVLRLVGEGQNNIAVAQRLGISPRTVENHRANLMRKLDLKSQSALIRYTILKGIVALE
jgi:two-component system response regulator NreC